MLSLKNPMTGILLLAGAAGGPYFLYETEAGKYAADTATNIMGASPSDQGTRSVHYGGPNPLAGDQHWGLTGTDPATNPLNPNGGQHKLDQPTIIQLSEVLRFDATPSWVVGRFPRVSTVLAELKLDGLRVPLVTGTQPTDLAGTLTYYFDQYKRLQRVTIHGVTGDPMRFAMELQSLYQLQQEPSLGGGLYVLKWNGRATSVMHIAPAPVIYGDAPYSRFNVFLELNQAGLEYGLSAEATALIQHGRETSRW